MTQLMIRVTDSYMPDLIFQAHHAHRRFGGRAIMVDPLSLWTGKRPGVLEVLFGLHGNSEMRKDA